MTSRTLARLLLTLVLAAPACLAGCSVHHTDSTNDNLFGGTTHKDTTVITNPDGTVAGSSTSTTVTH